LGESTTTWLEKPDSDLSLSRGDAASIPAKAE